MISTIVGKRIQSARRETRRGSTSPIKSFTQLSTKPRFQREEEVYLLSLRIYEQLVLLLPFLYSYKIANLLLSYHITLSALLSLFRRWYDDTIFKNQAKGEQTNKKRFINDTIRNDFHKKFLSKYIQ